MTLPPLKLNKMCVIDHRVTVETGDTPEQPTQKKRKKKSRGDTEVTSTPYYGEEKVYIIKSGSYSHEFLCLEENDVQRFLLI